MVYIYLITTWTQIKASLKIVACLHIRFYSLAFKIPKKYMNKYTNICIGTHIQACFQGACLSLPTLILWIIQAFKNFILDLLSWWLDFIQRPVYLQGGNMVCSVNKCHQEVYLVVIYWPCLIYVTKHVKDPYLSVIRVGHFFPSAGFCLSLCRLHVLNRDVKMIQ